MHAFYDRLNRESSTHTHVPVDTYRFLQDSKSVEDLLMRVDQRSGYVFANYDYERNPFGRLRPPDTDNDDNFFVDDNDENTNTTIDPM